MRLKIAFVIAFILLGLNTFCQKSVELSRVYRAKPINVDLPFMVDSTNMKGDKFQNKDFLQTYISIPGMDAFTEELKTDVSGYFFLSKAQKGARFHLLSFDFSTDKQGKTKLKVIGPSMYEVYVNGEKKHTKTTVEDSLSQAKFSEISFSAIPGTYNILIKYMSLPTNKSPEAMKVVLEAESKDSNINYTILRNADKRFVNIKDIIQGKRVTSLSTSPNGTHILLSYATTKDDGKIFQEKELLNVKTNRRVSLAVSRNYSWMPVSDKFYYEDKSEKELKVVVVDPETLSESVIARNIPSGSYLFTPDEKSLIYADSDEAKKGNTSLIRLKSPEDRQPGYDNRYFVSKYDIETGVKQRLTYGKRSTSINHITNDSRYLLFSTRKEITERPFSQTSMYILDMQEMKVDTLWTDEGYATSAKFSPDGKHVLIKGSAEAFGGIAKNLKDGEIPNSFDGQAFIMNVATKKVEAITRDFTPSVEKIYWSSGDGMIYLATYDKDYERIYRYNPDKKQFKMLPLKEDVVRLFSLSGNSASASYAGTSISNSSRAYHLDLKNDNSTLIADPSGKRLSEIRLGETRDWVFTASDGTKIDGRYYLPPNFDGTKKYPLIVYYYGGTLPTARTLEGAYPPHVYAALGYVVYVLQPSGATGYGQEFAARHVNTWGKRSANDIIEGTKQFVSEHSFVNGEKIGCVGASYGGFMTMYLQTQTDMFATAVSHAGISSISSYWGEGYWGYTYNSIASADSYPWNNKELYVDQSPLFSADKINTPLLLLHGTEDTNVPVGESIQMYTALKILGKPVEFIQVKGENHSIKDYNKRLQWNYTIYAWLAKWLQDDSSWWDSLYPN
ncbi:S9 family peptidase [Dysgonomonas sp. 520]|uniref:alpha/beta hydrolase family protein n=1 Tax=Dysgonomonas sp. 520 TaxID=2302931 RepID=UPI0013D6FFBE|nr:S9 family peptidase [Dysgonomonas sp. 520]NDW09943.1 S9 family peptidase [Dysgonomonas sp. 520]